MSDWLSRMAEQSGLLPAPGDGAVAAFAERSALPAMPSDGLHEEHIERMVSAPPAPASSIPDAPARTETRPAIPARPMLPEPELSSAPAPRIEQAREIPRAPQVAKAAPPGAPPPKIESAPLSAEPPNSERPTRAHIARVLHEWIAPNTRHFEAQAPAPTRMTLPEPKAREPVEAPAFSANRFDSVREAAMLPRERPDFHREGRTDEANEPRARLAPWPAVPARSPAEKAPPSPAPEASVALSIGSIQITIEAPTAKLVEARSPSRERAPGTRASRAGTASPVASPAADGSRLARHLLR
jgi:hypothetical protein